MQITVSQYLCRFFKSKQIDTVFELSGGMIMHLLDTLHQEGGIEIVSVYHEQAAAFAADAVGRLSGRPGVALGTSGPGAINLLTGVGSSFFDSSPTLFITGQVNRSEQKKDRKIRQLGFQETDIVAMARPITKLAIRLNAPHEILDLLPQAYAMACEGRPGAVLIDIPMDVFRAKIEVPEGDNTRLGSGENVANGVGEIAELCRQLKVAKRPLILAGNGIRASMNQPAFKRFTEAFNIPVVYSLLACDVLPFDHPLRVGMIGTYGNRWANLALSECDMLIVLGSRLDIRQTGADVASFGRGKTIYHVDVEKEEINNRVGGCIPVHTSLGQFFACLAEEEGTCCEGDRKTWLDYIGELRARWPDLEELREASGINPNAFMHLLSRGHHAAAYCVDVGLHQMWAAQSLELGEGVRLITSGGMGAMGFALPAAIGAAFYFKKSKPIVVVAGDAGFQLNIQELQTVAHHALPIKIVIMNNGCHGMTRQFQDTYFAERYVGTVWGYSPPNFAAIGTAYGIASRVVAAPREMKEAIKWLWREPLLPALVEVRIDLKTNAYPKLAFGKPISEMEPFSKPTEMEGT